MTREFLLAWRESLLQLLDTIERELGISPRTSELRQARRDELHRKKALNRKGEGDIIAVVQ